MASPEPAVRWFLAYPPLPLLASAAMSQPAGRLLGISFVNSVWLRVSPILCALDALALVMRCLMYCAILRATPRQALLIIGMDRFNEPGADSTTSGSTETAEGERGTTSRIAAIAKTASTTAARLAGFGLGIVPLVELAATSGGHEARWTAAWGWMFVGAYVVLELAAQVYRWEVAKPQYTPADFELEEGVERHGSEAHGDGDGDADDDEGLSYTETVASTKGDAPTKADKDEDDDDDEEEEEEAEGEQEETEDLLARTGAAGGSQQSEGDIYDGSTLAPATTTQSTAAGGASAADLEAAKFHPYEYNKDPALSPRLPALNNALGFVDKSLLGGGALLHTVLIYWAFLDLVQPLINRHILAVDASKDDGWGIATGWATPLFYLSLPFTFACLFLTMILSIGLGYLVLLAFVGAGKLVTAQLPQSVRGCCGGIAETIIFFGSYGLGGISVVISFFAGSPIIGGALLSPVMIWGYEMLSVEIVVFLIFFAASFGFYLLVKGLAASANTKWKDSDKAFVQMGLRYLQEDGVALLAVVLITVLLSLVWYAVRFAGSAHWAQHWSDALVANVTTTNGTMTNSTTNGTSGTPASASAAATAAAATLLHLL